MENHRPIEITRQLTSELHTEVYSVRWNNDDSTLACSRANGFIDLYDHTLNLTNSLDCKVKENLPVSSLRWKPNPGLTQNILIAATSEGAIMHWHTTSGRLIHTIFLEENQALCCDYAPSSETFSVGWKDHTIRVYDENTKQIMNELKSHADAVGHGNRVLSLKYNGNDTLFSAGWDNNVYMWDLRVGQVVKHFHGAIISGDSIDVFGDQLMVTDCSMREQLKVWSIAEEKILVSENLQSLGKPFQGYTCQFSKHEKGVLAFAGGLGNMQGYLFRTRDFSVVNTVSHLTKSIYTCDFGNINPVLAIGTGDGTVNILNISR